jgi:hypothetical protein
MIYVFTINNVKSHVTTATFNLDSTLNMMRCEEAEEPINRAPREYKVCKVLRKR